MNKEKIRFGSAQGTVEYLVVVGILVVIMLGAVGVISGFFNQASTVDPVASKTYWLSQTIGVVESSIDTSGDGELVLVNNAEDTVTIRTVNLGGTDVTVNKQLVRGEIYEFELSGVMPCAGNKMNYEIRINYTTSTGLTKSFAGIKPLIVSCTDNVLVNGSANYIVGDLSFDSITNLLNESGTISLYDANLIGSMQLDSFADANIDVNASYSGGRITLGIQ